MKVISYPCLFLLTSLLTPAFAPADEATIARGEYLTQLLGCGRCHTDGELLGRRDGPWLAGSTIGIAYTDYEDNASPGIVFARNLTPDVATGLGDATREQIVRSIRSGVDHHEGFLLNVMPWPTYGLLSNEDAGAIADYLQSLDPVVRAIPENVPKGTPSTERYVRFSIYTFSSDDVIGIQPLPIEPQP